MGKIGISYVDLSSRQGLDYARNRPPFPYRGIASGPVPEPQDCGGLGGWSWTIDDEKRDRRYIREHPWREKRRTMERAYRATLFALYQLTLFAGILLMPVALVTSRFGIRLPVDRAVLRLKAAYERTAE
jgi:hypothetical protein